MNLNLREEKRRRLLCSSIWTDWKEVNRYTSQDLKLAYMKQNCYQLNSHFWWNCLILSF